MKRPTLLVILALVIFIVGLTISEYKSEKTIIQDARKIAERTFKNAANEGENSEKADLPFYLPKGFHVTEQDKNNIILENKEQTFLIFNNGLESADSELNYTAAARNEDALLIESFQDKEKFGYIRIVPDEENHYELQVGVGGVKITTFTPKTNLENDARELMKIALSLAFQNE
ncbi:MULTISPECIES: hypothetical protein [unclassified Virgibacillus]|uniref:hypothetical protein n=1 Tax=unclassified Virgibacillus TaxID=2620237 RepID=UPI0024DE0892|nr:hypothetical protein [Virgibacillus sp. LDC-1]